MEDETGEAFIAADTVINASGMRTDPQALSAFADTAPFVRAIGDVKQVGMIADAVLSAREAVTELNA